MIGVILAGGENKRIPLLKGHIEINGQRIIDSNIKILKRFFDKVVISTNSPENYFYCGVPMIGDVIRQRGPLTGIFSVLLNTEDDIFIIGCDMPFIDERLIKYIIDKYKAQNSKLKELHAVIPVFEGHPQPLFGIYSKGIIDTVERRLYAGQSGMRDLLTELKALYINEQEIKKIDPMGRSFVNINTMEDYKKIVNSKH
jgi:molybdopterin-guanine dinucleotide biosynthesis protein A